MGSYTIDHKHRSRYATEKTAGELKYCNFLGIFNKTIIPLTLVGYEIIIANSALHASLAIHHLISMHAHGIIVKCTGTPGCKRIVKCRVFFLRVILEIDLLRKLSFTFQTNKASLPSVCQIQQLQNV